MIFCGSCGFQIIYRENQGDSISYEKELSTIRIKKTAGHLAQELRAALKDSFNPDYLESEPKYFLVVNIKKSVTGTFITFTGASGRNKVILDVDYELRDIKTGELLAIGTTIASDNYDVTKNRFGTYTAEDYVGLNLTKIVAQNIRNLLVNDLIEITKEIEELKRPENKDRRRKVIGIISDDKRQEINNQLNQNKKNALKNNLLKKDDIVDVPMPTNQSPQGLMDITHP